MERYVLTRKEVRPRTSGRKIERPIVLGDLERAFVGLMFDKRYSRQMRQQLGRLNKLLVLLAVLIIECGGGLALAVGMALGERPLGDQTAHRGTVHSSAPAIKETPAAPIEITPAHNVHSPTLSARDRLLQMVRNDKGVLRTGHRALGEALGISATRAGQLLKQLAEDGAIRVRAGKTGTVITLAPRVVGA